MQSAMQRTAVGLCFFISGMCGLIYEMVWGRMLGLVFGNSTFAVSTVLTVFMIGMAAGSLLFGRIIDKGASPLRLYAWLEIGIGVYALLFSHILPIQESFYFLYQPDSNHLLSSLALFLFCFLALLLPTVLMGGTLPVLSKLFVTQPSEKSTAIGRLYALNTFGAVLGAMVSGYFMILHLGVTGTIYLTAGLNLLIGLVILFFTQTQSVKPALYSEDTISIAAAKRNSILLAMFLSGFAALAYEVAWTRMFALLLGSSVYAFSVMLMSFLGGMAFGSFWFSEQYGRKPVGFALFAVFELVIGIYCLLLIPGFNELVYWSQVIHVKFGDQFVLLQVLQFALCFYAVLLPTALFGATFPLAAALYLQNMRQVGGDIGAVYFFNTLGSALGSFLTGFVLIPLIGIRNSMVLAVALNLLVSNMLFLRQPYKARWWLSAVSVCVISLAFFFHFDKQLVTSGAFLYNYGPDFRQLATKDKLLYYGEGTTCLVSVHEQQNDDLQAGGAVRYLRVNGKTDASTKGDMGIQLLTGHLPMLAATQQNSVALVGLGSGVSAAAITAHKPQEVFVIEIEGKMVEAAAYFSDVNHHVLNDPRVRCIIADGRHFLQSRSQKFDVIISEPSNPWIAGIGNLFSDDFYRTARQKLNPGGVFAQWVTADRTAPALFMTMVKTYISNFPNASMWECADGHYLLIGYNSEDAAMVPLDQMKNRFEELKRNPTVAADLSSIGIDSFADIAIRFVLDAAELRTLTAGVASNSDNWPVLEFLAPYTMHEHTTERNREAIKAVMQHK